jgi:hypothetical protein
MSLSDEQHDLT